MKLHARSGWTRGAIWGILLASKFLYAQDLLITDAYCGSKPPGSPATRQAIPACTMGDTLTVEFSNLDTWMDGLHLTDPSSIVLALDGRTLKNTSVLKSATNQLQFELKRSSGSTQADTDNHAAWKQILSRAMHDHAFLVGVGTVDKIFVGASPKAPEIWVTVYPTYTWISGLFLAALLVAFLVLAKKSDIIRDPGPTPAQGKQLCYSLARSQMAWWLFIALFSFHYIWLITGDRDSLSNTILILMGISAATGLGAVAIDGGKRDQRADLETEQTSLNADIAVLTAKIGAAPPPANIDDLKTQLAQKQSRLAEIKTSVAGLPGGAGWTSDGFLKDILRDDSGVSFHRFQLAAWTVVLGFVFIVSVIQDLAMPEFSTTLLALMGVSSGTYIGFKIPDPPK
jgi:hypothetical protein